MAEQESLFDVGDNISQYDQNEISRQLALNGVSMALDNGSDMLGVDATEHAKEEWPAYIGHAVQLLLDVADRDSFDAHVCYNKAILIAPELYEEMHLSLNIDHIEQFDLERFK